MKRLILLMIATLAIALTGTAQTPDAIREFISKNPNFSEPTVTTYENVKIGKIASAPKGYKPFYFTMTSRHGSRYELQDTTYINLTAVYNRAAEQGILTPLGEEIRQILNRASNEQKGKEGELTSLGQKQLRGIGRRAYLNFKSVFDSGTIEGKSSTKMRCVFSMVAFIDGLKEKNSTLPVEIEARESHLGLLRPMANHPDTPKEVIAMWGGYGRAPQKTWANKFVAQVDKSKFATMLSKVVTRPELLVEKCGAPNLFQFFCNTHHLLLFSQNLEVCDDAILKRTFTLDEHYLCYLYQTTRWLHWSGGWGNPYIECYSSYLRPLVEDILCKAQEAIEGKNPHIANIRFTHDTYVAPLLTVLGYNNCALQYSEDWEKGCCSIPFSTLMPMGANLQMVLYRNKEGKVLVRSLLNEQDAFLPIECDTAPFYPWDELCALARANMAKLDKSRDKLFPKLKR